jgi:hypothetical protein
MPTPIPDELRKWREVTHDVENPPTEFTDEMRQSHPFLLDEYEPVFPRTSLTRHVLSNVTDEEHFNNTPRNTADQIGLFMATDPIEDMLQPQQAVEDPENPGTYSLTDHPTEIVQRELDKLAEKGLIEKRDDGSYVLTRDGWIEILN